MLGRLAFRAFARKTSLTASKVAKLAPAPPPLPPPESPKSKMTVGPAARKQFLEAEFPKELKTAGLTRKDVDDDFLNYVIST